MRLRVLVYALQFLWEGVIAGSGVTIALDEAGEKVRITRATEPPSPIAAPELWAVLSIPVPSNTVLPVKGGEPDTRAVATGDGGEIYLHYVVALPTLFEIRPRRGDRLTRLSRTGEYSSLRAPL